MAGTPFPTSRTNPVILAPEHSKFHSGTNEGVDRWLHPTSDPRRYILEDTQFREKQAPATVRSHLGRYTASFRERERELGRIYGIVENLVDE